MEYVLGCGMYGLKTEKQFVMKLVEAAAVLIKREGTAAFRSRARDFMFEDVYVFVTSEKGIELVNPAFPDQLFVFHNEFLHKHYITENVFIKVVQVIYMSYSLSQFWPFYSNQNNYSKLNKSQNVLILQQ